MRRLAALALAAALAGCASPRVTLLEGEAGAATGSVAVLDARTGAERGSLTTANTEAVLGRGEVRPQPVDPARHAALLAAMPRAPQRFSLYFVEGTTGLTDESKAVLEELKRLVTPEAEVQIIGHTDAVGGLADNDALSLRRASEVRSALVAMGLPVENARVSARGEREPAVPTADDVAEPRNRRVEVLIR